MTDLHISKESIENLFSKLSRGKKFIIPDYQRPYSWDIEKCETLWEDIKAFSKTEEAMKHESYFLGTIVSYENNEDQEIIDGQQRMTSFMLLLRAFYTQLEEMDGNNKNVIGLKQRLEPCIWEIDRISREVSNKANIKIFSDVATEIDNETFHKIIETGKFDESKSDNYTKNYKYFLDISQEYAKQHPMDWENLCVTILEQCIILPIKCDSQDTALTIFSTLNDRGLPLSDSDIFKAKMYKVSENRKEFVEKWKEFSEICKLAELTIDDIFRYYSHVIRARNENTDKEIALRRFYLNHLKDVDLDSLISLAKFWLEIRNFDSAVIERDEGYISLECRKYIQCLSHYPNDYWKYVVSVFFFSKKEYSNEEFLVLLRKLVAFLFLKFIENPTVNAIKTDIFKFCVFIYWKEEKGEQLKLVNKDEIFKRIELFSNSKLTRALILLHSYISSMDKQKKLISSNFNIEHIFPKKWQDTNYNGWSIDEAESYLERLGNKIPFESRLNIQAGNGYFGKKKEKYSSSDIYEVQQLSQYPKSDWNKEDIEKREEQMIELLKNFFNNNL